MRLDDHREVRLHSVTRGCLLLSTAALTALAGCQAVGVTSTGSGDAPDASDGFDADIGACHTTVSGTVYDPAGALPLYNVLVYVPTTALDPIQTGLGPTCERCQALAGGAPTAFAVSDAKGRFVLHDPPAGENVTLVVQTGKWRRQVQLPRVEACKDNALTDPNLSRLPQNQSEGSLPLIAVTTGIDALECTLLKRIGIDLAEFTSPQGGGRVHNYWGPNPAYQHPFLGGWGDADDLFGSLETLKKYDVVVDPCQAEPFQRGTGTTEYENLEAYLNVGGRFFASHLDYTWFARNPPPGSPACTQPQQQEYSCMCTDTCNASPLFASTASWGPNLVGGPFLINLSLPKGVALDTWFQAASALEGTPATPPGQVFIQDRTFNFLGSVNASASSWIFQGDLGGATNTVLMSFNAPVGQAPAAQCGRATYFDGHEHGGTPQLSTFPVSCGQQPGEGSELLFEYFFFDLGTCIGDDAQTPVVPR